MNCNNCGDGVLMPYSGGSWVSIEEGDERSVSIYCAECGQVYRVEQKIKQVEEDGMVEDRFED